MVSEDSTAVWLPLLEDLTYREIHALEDGFYVGYRGIETDEEEEYEQEKHYWRIAWLAGHFTDKYVERNCD